MGLPAARSTEADNGAVERMSRGRVDREDDGDRALAATDVRLIDTSVRSGGMATIRDEMGHIDDRQSRQPRSCQ